MVLLRSNVRTSKSIVGLSRTVMSAFCIIFGDLINDFGYFVWHLGENNIEFGDFKKKMVGDFLIEFGDF